MKGLIEKPIAVSNRFSVLAVDSPEEPSSQASSRPRNRKRRPRSPESKRAHKKALKQKKQERAQQDGVLVSDGVHNQAREHTTQVKIVDERVMAVTGNGDSLGQTSRVACTGTMCKTHVHVSSSHLGAPAWESVDNQDWMIDKKLFQKVVRLAGREFDMDLFAARDGSNAYCSEYCFAEGRSVFDEDYRGKAVYANPAFNLLFPFVVHYLITKVLDVGTSAVLVVPVWKSKAWWPLVQHFRVLCRWQKGSNIFSAPPLAEGGARRLVGPTKWHVVAVADDAGEESARKAFALLKALCSDAVNIDLQYEDEDARARVVVAAQQKLCLLLKSFAESQRMGMPTIYRLFSKVQAPSFLSMQGGEQVVASSPGQQVAAAVQASDGNAGSVNDAGGS